MDDNFKQETKFYAEMFGVAQTTLKDWANSEERDTHRELLTFAAQAIKSCPELNNYLDTPSGELEQLAVDLGIDNPLNVPITGLPLRTWRKWFQTPKRSRLTAGFLLGMHWQAIEAMAVKKGESPMAILSKLNKLKVTPDKVVRLYRVDPETVCALL